ncbi:MAG: deoxyribose-phosphate aldolase, partial [Bacteroidota bacterium]
IYLGLMQNLASHLDYTALKPGMTQRDALKLCAQADEYGFAAACLPPYFVSLAGDILSGSPVKVCTVVGFPHGMHLMEAKLVETQQLIQAGAEELDLVANLAAFRSGELAYWQEEIKAFAQLCRQARVTSKVIIESGLLSLSEVKTAANLCAEAQVDFVKTPLDLPKLARN